MDDARKLARPRGPISSKESAEHVAATLPARMAEALAALRRHPGRTSNEIEELEGVRDGRVRKRLAGLLEAGLARKGVKRACGVTGQPAYEWWPAEARSPPRSLFDD